MDHHAVTDIDADMISPEPRRQPQQDALQTPVILDGHVMPRNLKSVGKDETWLTKQLHAQGYHDAGEVLLALCDNSGADAKLYPLHPKKPAGEVN